MWVNLEYNSSQKSEVSILLNEITSCNTCISNESLCGHHAELLKKILVQESQKDLDKK